MENKGSIPLSLGKLYKLFFLFFFYSIDRTPELIGAVPRREKNRAIISINDSQKWFSQLP